MTLPRTLIPFLVTCICALVCGCGHKGPLVAPAADTVRADAQPTLMQLPQEK